MKPRMLHGHERAITQIKYNREGDLLFSCSKDQQPNVWYPINGERLGTFDGHGGAVWCIDVNYDTTNVITGAGDNTVRLWDCSTGIELARISTPSSVRTCNFSYSANMAMYTTDRQMKKECEVHVIDVRTKESMADGKSIMSIQVPENKVTSSLWGPLDEYLITGQDKGDLTTWDLKTGGKMINSVREHTLTINDMQYNKDQTMFITASKDNTAKLFDTASLMLLKTYKTERPVNSASISPIRDHVVMGGGQEAMDVTTTSTRIGKFDARFFHLIFEEEFGRVKGHFGPINSVCFHPDGKSYASGGEDGYIRVHDFDQSYLDYQFEC